MKVIVVFKRLLASWKLQHAIYSNGGNRWNILGFNFTKRDALSIVYIRYLCSQHAILENENNITHSMHSLHNIPSAKGVSLSDYFPSHETELFKRREKT